MGLSRLFYFILSISYDVLIKVLRVSDILSIFASKHINMEDKFITSAPDQTDPKTNSLYDAHQFAINKYDKLLTLNTMATKIAERLIPLLDEKSEYIMKKDEEFSTKDLDGFDTKDLDGMEQDIGIVRHLFNTLTDIETCTKDIHYNLVRITVAIGNPEQEQNPKQNQNL